MSESPLPTSQSVARSVLAGLLLLAAAGGAFYQVWREAVSVPSVTAVPLPVDEIADVNAEAASAMREFFESDARPLINQTRAQDLGAVERAVASLDAAFARYAEGCPKFAAALTGWGMRFKIIYRKSVETAERKSEHSWTAQLVQEKFDKCIVSDHVLEADVMEVLKQFAYDLEASRNAMLAEIKTRLTAAHLSVPVKEIVVQKLENEWHARLKEMLAALPGRSVMVGVGSLTAGIVAEEAVRQLVRAAVTQAAARLATSAAVSGGAAGTAVAAGGAGGTVLAPGVGTAIGVAGGFLVGAVVDWWMTDKFEEKVTGQCRQFLRKTQVALISGEQGLEAMLKAQVEQANKAYVSALASQ